MSLYGRRDWYIVRTERNKMAVRREDLIRPGEARIAGPYETRQQARCEAPTVKPHYGDPERMLWVPGEKLIPIPRGLKGLQRPLP